MTSRIHKKCCSCWQEDALYYLSSCLWVMEGVLDMQFSWVITHVLSAFQSWICLWVTHAPLGSHNKLIVLLNVSWVRLLLFSVCAMYKHPFTSLQERLDNIKVLLCPIVFFFCCFVLLNMTSMESNTRPHANIENTLPNEPSLQLNRMLHYFWIKY